MTETISQKLQKIAENTLKVYEAGVDVGRQAEYDAWWDSFTNFGSRRGYQNAFMYWGSDYIRPNRKIVPVDTSTRSSTFNRANIKAIEKEYFDFSQCPRGTSNQQGWYYTFFSCPNLEVIEDVGIKNAYAFVATFSSSPKLHTIECIYPDADTRFQETFDYCNALVNLRVNGVIGQPFDIHWSRKLSKESIVSIINALSDMTDILPITFSEAAVNKAFETSTGANDGSSSDEWDSLLFSKRNWVISLI